MTHDTPRSDEILWLLSVLVDGVLTDAQTARLRELLRDEPTAQDLYLKYMGVHTQLHLDYGSGATPADMPGESSMPHAPPSTPPPDGDVLKTMGRARAARASSPRSPWRLVMAFGGGLAAAFLLIGLVWLSWPKGSEPEPPTATARPPMRVAPEAGIAMVVKLDDARWDHAQGPHPAEGEVLAEGARLGLRSGRVTLSFLNGIMLTVEGPADLELVSLDRVYCHRGKIRTHVPPGAEGFVVSAPGSNVTDLGTEFGLNVEDDGRARMMVFEGVAEAAVAAVLEASGSAQRNRSVTKDRALEIDPLRFQLSESEASAESFIAATDLATPTLALAPDYRDEVLKARPWGYWRFESIDGGAVANEVDGRPPLRATGPLRLAGAGNRSVAFDDNRTEQYLMMDGRWAPPRDPGYAVELWFSPARFALAELAGLFLHLGEDQYHHVFQLELTSRGRESILFRRASIRFLHRWPPGFTGGDNLFCDYYVPRRWHHVVTQLRDDRMELYVDGKALPTLSVSPDRATEACQLIVGQLKPLPRPRGAWENRPFIGQIDEVALYDRPLSAEEIRRHHALGTPGGRTSEP